MTATMAFRRPTALPIHPETWVRPAGSTDFRVTQRFAVPDSFYGGRQQHNAVDLGNFRCGDAVTAMAPGIARRTQDNAVALGAKTNALGVIIDHGSNVQSEYWHLNGYSVASGVRVSAGQQIGLVGRTGLGDVCHLHVEVKRFGVRIDPEPLMFGTPLNLEDDVNIPPGLAPLAIGVVGSGNRLRRDPASTEGSRVLEADYQVQVYGYAVVGAPYTLAGKEGDRYAWVGQFGELWYVAEPLLTAVKPTDRLPSADCSAQEQELAVIRTKLARAATSAQGAAQAAIATVEALRT
jgi:murein DD-endopeptidase MepM/ murein hydrolase activator NlpD